MQGERYQLPLTKREAKQLYDYMFIAEDADIKPKPTNKFWERHEVLVQKLHVIIYDAGTATRSSEKPKKK